MVYLTTKYYIKKKYALTYINNFHLCMLKILIKLVYTFVEFMNDYSAFEMFVKFECGFVQLTIVVFIYFSRSSIPRTNTRNRTFTIRVKCFH